MKFKRKKESVLWGSDFSQFYLVFSCCAENDSLLSVENQCDKQFKITLPRKNNVPGAGFT